MQHKHNKKANNEIWVLDLFHGTQNILTVYKSNDKDHTKIQANLDNSMSEFFSYYQSHRHICQNCKIWNKDLPLVWKMRNERTSHQCC